jgi:hypothetical protein
MPTLLKGDMKHDYGRDPFKGIIKVVETPGLAQMFAFGIQDFTGVRSSTLQN